MPFIPLKERPFKNIDSLGNTKAIEAFIDADKDDFFNNKKRKGLGLFVDLGTGAQVDGIFSPINTEIVVAFSAGRIFKIESDKTVTEITSPLMDIGIPVKTADFGNTGYFCNGGKILKWVYTEPTAGFLTDPSTPTSVTHMGFLDQYLLAMDKNSQRFEWSDVGTPDNWLGEFAAAESRPDRLSSLTTAFGEIFLAGTETLEFWVDSGSAAAPFQRLSGTLTERGSLSPYSFIQIDNSFMFLDTQRRVIRLDGRTPQVVSNPFDSQFQALDTVSDAIGMHFNAEGDTKYILTFPTADKTFVYDYKLDVWSEWSSWDTVNTTRSRWIGNCGTLTPKWNKYLVGTIDGKVAVPGSVYDDDLGGTINTEIITGRIDWGTSKRKSCTKLRIKVKRGVGSQTTPKQLVFSYRDNGKQQWSQDKIVDLGIAGDTEVYKTFRNLKTYRDRQWRFKISSGELLLISVEEDVRVI